MEGGTRLLLRPSWTHLGENDLRVVPDCHMVQLDRDPEGHIDGEAPLAQVFELHQGRTGDQAPDPVPHNSWTQPPHSLQPSTPE